MLIRMLILLACCQPIVCFATDALPGGYNTIDLADKQLQQVVAFAVQQLQQGSLVKVISAQRQVVAGLNYSIQLEIANANAVPNIYNVIVYVPLPNTNQAMQITNVEYIGQATDTSTVSNQQ